MAALKDACIVAIIRMTRGGEVGRVATALLDGGCRVIEVTMNTPGALDEIRKLTASPSAGWLVGAGTVTTAEEADASVEAGARFIVTPYSRKAVIERAHALGVPVLSGAFSPGEIAQALEWGADVVKVFPAAFLGPEYLKAVRAPLGEIPLMPTGGVTAENLGTWLTAGATLVGVGAALVSERWIAGGAYGEITERARQFQASLAQHRAHR